MTLEEALTAEVGDTMYAVFTTTQTQKGDDVILVERARDFNNNPKDTGGMFYHRERKELIGGNIQDFRFQPIIKT